ncbi:MAG: hypothetical protein KDE27_27390 [Planctomycetes bacterium]|nr:hypothetical protein [Planctomycetota bacterium]
MGPLFLVTERFDPSCGARWHDYVAWSKLTQLEEVVSLDSNLCPNVITEILDEDWGHIVNADFMLDYFTDLPYLLRRVGSVAGRNLLCLFQNPETEPSAPVDEHGFRYVGCDLVDEHGGISALTNCGGFPLAFANAELDASGLIPSLARAREVRQALRQHYPDEDHACCDIWSVFRATR